MKWQKGFTLIEILVGMTIIGVLFGIGYVNFRGYSRRQVVSGAGKLLLGDLRLAQQLALSGQKPADVSCTAAGRFLNGYNFSIISDSKYKIQAECSGGAVVTLAKEVVLPSGIKVSASPNSTVLFKVLGHGTNIDAATGSVVFTLTQDITNNKYWVTVTSGGSIYGE